MHVTLAWAGGAEGLSLSDPAGRAGRGGLLGLGRSAGRRTAAAARALIVLVLVVVFALPLASAVLTSLKTRAELYALPAALLPKAPRWENYLAAWTMVRFGRFLLNSLAISLFYTLPCVMGSCLAGYAFSRFRVREGRALFLVVLSTLMVPPMVTVVPLYLLISRYGIVDRRWLWLLFGLQGAPFLIFLFRQYFSTVPLSFEESARLEGAGRFRIFFCIMLPLVQTAVIIAGIFAFQWSWSDYLMPVLFLRADKLTLAVKLARGYTDAKQQLLANVSMAGIAYYTAPILILFFTVQRRFVTGLLSGGLKG